MLDPHCHLDDPLLEGQLELLSRLALDHKVHSVLIPSYGPTRWPRQSELVMGELPIAIWGAFGIHPWALSPALKVAQYQTQLQQGWNLFASKWGSKLKAIGEFGLDRSSRCKDLALDLQLEVFKLHLNLASEHKLPAIIHLVKADGPVQAVLKHYPLPHGGVVHGFSSHPQTVAQYVKLGLALSFGPSLLKNAKVQEALKATPQDQILFETDAPQALIKTGFSSPYGPHHLKKVIIAASKLMGKSVEYLLNLHTKNCNRIFNLQPGAARE